MLKDKVRHNNIFKSSLEQTLFPANVKLKVARYFGYGFYRVDEEAKPDVLIGDSISSCLSRRKPVVCLWVAVLRYDFLTSRHLQGLPLIQVFFCSCRLSRTLEPPQSYGHLLNCFTKESFLLCLVFFNCIQLKIINI